MKKMRKLLPAFAMLLVSAIMMSTASFAWFTMNESVTATGMQVQAKSTGSLVIADEPLQDTHKKTEVTFQTGAQTLKPITLNKTTGKWSQPVDGKKVDTATGLLKDTSLEEVTPAADNYHDEEIYIGSAGDALPKQSITITLSAPISAVGSATKAYAAAIYVITDTNDSAWADNATVDATAVPTEIVWVDTAENRNIVTLTNDGNGYTIPSTVGVQNSNYVGLKIIIRFYVDGDLTSVGNDTKPVTTYNYVTVAQDAKYTAGTTYYVQNEGVWGLANVSGYEVDSDIPDDWATLVSTTENVNYKYVNSAEVPTTASTLEIEFKAATITP